MRRTLIIASFLLMYGAAFGQLSQFRMVGSGSWSTIDATTFSSTVTIQSDLTGNGFLPTGITDSMLIFTQTGQRYTISSAINLTFSSADLTIVESGGDWGAPVGQVMIYEDNGRNTVPSIPFSSTGATAKMQEAIVSYNATIDAQVADGDKGEVIVSGGNWLLDNNVVDQANLANDAVTNAKIASEAVTGDKIAENTVDNNNLTATGVIAGSYTNSDITVNSAGRITSISNGSGSGGGGSGLSVLDSTFTANYTASTDSTISRLTAITESNDIVVTLPTPTANTVGISYTINQVDRNNDGLGFTLVQVDGIDYDMYFSGDTLQFVAFTPDLDESFTFQTIYLDNAYRWLGTKLSSARTFEVSTRSEIQLGNYDTGDRIVLREATGQPEAVYYVADTIAGLEVDTIGQIPSGGGKHAILDELTKSRPVIHLDKLGVKKGADYSDIVEKYIAAFSNVEVVFPRDTLQLLDIYIADNNHVTLNFEETFCIFPTGADIDIIDDTMHVFNFKNVNNIYVKGQSTFDHSDTSSYNLILMPKWNNAVDRTNQIFHIESGVNYEQHGVISIEGVSLDTSWYNLAYVNTQNGSHNASLRTYDVVELTNSKINYAPGGLQSRGNIGLFRMDRVDSYIDAYKNRWTSSELGRTGPNQEVTVVSDMKVEVTNSNFFYEGFFVQNAKDTYIANTTFQKNGYWRDLVNNVDSIIWNKNAIDSTTAVNEGRLVRSAGGAMVKIDHALQNQAQTPRTQMLNNVRFLESNQEFETTIAAPATNFQSEGENIDATYSNCLFDDVIKYGGSPGVARAPIFESCVFLPFGQITISDGFTMNNCVFRDSLNFNANPYLIDLVDTLGTWETSRSAWRSTGANNYYPVRVSNTNFYSRTITISNNKKGVQFNNCNFFDYSGISLGNSSSVDTNTYNLRFYNSYGGRLRVTNEWTQLTDSTNIDIVNHKDLLISDANLEALLACPSCDINNIDVLDYTNGIPHDQTAYRADLSARTLVKDYQTYDDSLKINKGVVISERPIVGDLGTSLLKLESANGDLDTLLDVFNGSWHPFTLFNDGKFITAQSNGDRTQFWGDALSVTRSTGSITDWTWTTSRVLGAFTQMKLSDGSASTPTYGFNSDLNTGMYRVGPDHIGISTGGSLGLEINNSQELLGNGRFFTIDNPNPSPSAVDSLQNALDYLASGSSAQIAQVVTFNGNTNDRIDTLSIDDTWSIDSRPENFTIIDTTTLDWNADSLSVGKLVYLGFGPKKFKVSVSFSGEMDGTGDASWVGVYKNAAIENHSVKKIFFENASPRDYHFSFIVEMETNDAIDIRFRDENASIETVYLYSCVFSLVEIRP